MLRVAEYADLLESGMKRKRWVLLLLSPVAACASLDGLTGGSLPSPDAGTVDARAPDAPPGDERTATTPDAPADVTASDGASDGSLGAPDTASCEAGLTACGGQCTDLTQDPNNCGACANVCATGLCGTALTETMAAQPALWTFNGSAQWNSFAPSAELTAPGVTNQAGSVLYAHPIATDSFVAQFQFRIGLDGGTRSDGMGFVIETNGATAVGGAGGGLGMTGLTGYGVELDIHDNATCGDTSDDHVGVDALTLCSASEGTPTSLAAQDVTADFDLADTHWHTAIVTLSGGQVGLSIDGTEVLSGVALTGFASGSAYTFGFTGGTGGLVLPDGGGGGYRQEVKNVSVTFPTPRCL